MIFIINDKEVSCDFSTAMFFQQVKEFTGKDVLTGFEVDANMETVGDLHKYVFAAHSSFSEIKDKQPAVTIEEVKRYFAIMPLVDAVNELKKVIVAITEPLLKFSEVLKQGEAQTQEKTENP